MLKQNKEIVARLVNWQLAKKRQGTHKVKERGEVIGSTAKIYKQKEWEGPDMDQKK